MRELQAQVAMLREALLIGRARTMDDINGAHPGEAKDDAIADLVLINKTLAATESTEAEYRKQIENGALERAARHFEAMGDGKEMFATTVAFELTAMKG
jgi:hypothetical protein